MGYDLGINTKPGRILSSSEFHQLIEDFRDETGLDGPCELTECDFEPDEIDLKWALEFYLEQDAVGRSEFEAFCVARHVDPRAESRDLLAAARDFQLNKEGQDVFCAQMPPSRYEDEVRDAYRKIIDFARRHQVVVHDPQVGRDIDLDVPGEFPPMWGPTRAELDAASKRKWWM